MPFSELTFSGCPGSSALSSRRIASRLSFDAAALARTVTLKNCRPPRVSQIIRLVSPGALPLTMISVRADGVGFGHIAQADGDALIGRAVSTSTVLPTATERSLVESWMEVPAGCRRRRWRLSR